MVQQAEKLVVRTSRPFATRPPIPHEHGAWIMLYVPLIVGFLAAGGASLADWTWLLAAVTGLFLAREAFGLLLRKRAREGTAFWLAAYLIIAMGGIVPLLSGPSGSSLLVIAAVGAIVMALHSTLLLIPTRKRLDRTVYGEMLGACGLSLTSPAAWAITRGGLDPGAWIVWGLCALYFGGSIVYVKMWLEAVKHKKEWNEDRRTEVGRATLVFHATLTAGLFVNWGSGSAIAGGLLLMAYAPALIRAFRGWRKLSPALPNLKMVGLFESVIAVWFGVFLVAALRAGI